MITFSGRVLSAERAGTVLFAERTRRNQAAHLWVLSPVTLHLSLSVAPILCS